LAVDKDHGELIMDIYALAEIAEAAQIDVQKRCPLLDPIIGVSRALREAGFAVDLMTIDCWKSGKRITLLVNDEQPGEIGYQQGLRDRAPDTEFTPLPAAELTVPQLSLWIRDYFSAPV
jgi:hypothetical protein